MSGITWHRITVMLVVLVTLAVCATTIVVVQEAREITKAHHQTKIEVDSIEHVEEGPI